MPQVRVSESRVYDHIYDPIHSNSIIQYKENATTRLEISKNRFKFYQKPTHISSESIFQLDEKNTLASQSQKVNTIQSKPEPFSKDVSVQTVYRESDCQTDPYSPNYSINLNETKDILLLENLSFNDYKNLNIRDINAIIEARMKRDLMNNLPPVTDEASILMRKKLLEEQELREFRIHIAELDRLRIIKLENLNQQRLEREKQEELERTEKLNTIRAQKQLEYTKKMEKCKKIHERELRQITRSRESNPFLKSEHANKNINNNRDDYNCRGTFLFDTRTNSGLNQILNKVMVSYKDDEFLDDSLNITKQNIKDTEILHNLNTLQNEQLELPKILVHAPSRLTQERYTSSTKRNIRQVHDSLDMLYASITRSQVEGVTQLMKDEQSTTQTMNSSDHQLEVDIETQTNSIFSDTA